jgi:hypothetical protein
MVHAIVVQTSNLYCKIICCSPSPVFCCSRVWTISVSSCLLLFRYGNRPSPPCTSCTIRCGNRPLLVVAYISHIVVGQADLSHCSRCTHLVHLYIYQSKTMEKSSSAAMHSEFQSKCWCCVCALFSELFFYRAMSE